MKNFELFMCCLGNGITVCNKAVMEYGDYKQIAHISNAGNIKLYVSDNYIPAEEMEKIKNVAKANKEKFVANFEKLPKLNQYSKILDALPCQQMCDALRDKRDVSEKIPELREWYYAHM